MLYQSTDKDNKKLPFW